MTVMEERDKIWEEEAEYLKLKTVIERISAAPSTQDGLKAKVSYLVRSADFLFYLNLAGRGKKEAVI